MMQVMDRTFWRVHTPETTMVISAVLELEDGLSIDDLRAVVRERVQPVGRFRDRVVDGHTARPRWLADEAFDLSAHVRESLLGDASNQALWNKVGNLLAEPFDEARPLWTFDLVHRPEAHSVVVVKIHHSIADGITLMVMLLSLADLPDADRAALQIDDGPNPLAELFAGKQHAPERAHGYIERLMPAARALLLRGLGIAGWLWPVAALKATTAMIALALSRHDPHYLRSPRSAQRRVAWTDDVAVAELKRIGKERSATINDLVLAAVAGGIHRYLKNRHDTLTGDIRAAVPINLRPLRRMASLGNQLGFLFVPLPLAATTINERLAHIRKSTQRLKRSGQPLGNYATLGLMGAGPLWLKELLVRILDKRTSMIMTNVPGPIRKLAIAGTPIQRLIFWVPTNVTGLGIGIGSYAGNVCIGVQTDPTAIDAPETLAAHINEELASLLAPSSLQTPIPLPGPSETIE